MSKIKVIFYLFLFIKPLYAQGIFISGDSKHIPVEPQRVDKYTTLDSAKLIVTYSVSIINDTNDKVIDNDIQVLQIGSNYSKSYSQLQYEGDSIYYDYIRKGARSAPWFQKNVPPIEAYKNYKEKRNCVSYRLFGSKTVVLLYKEDFEKIEWQITQERKSIHSYSCQKAVGKFRGRTYEAWFTYQIPIGEGPYKFSGLPGLILEISDTQKHYEYTLIGIESPTKKIPIKFWQCNYQEIDRDKLLNTVSRAYKNPYQHLKLNGIELYMQDNTNADKVSFPYNPIELE